MKKNIAFALFACLAIAVSVSGCAFSSYKQAYMPQQKSDKQVQTFVNRVLADGYFKAFASSEDFRGISELADFSNEGDRAIRNESVLYPVDNSTQICSQVIQWAESLGVTEMTGPKETGWVSVDTRDPKPYCLGVLNGSLKWMPDGLASEEFLMQGLTGKPAFNFVVSLARTEEIADSGELYNQSISGKPASGRPTYAPKYRYTLSFNTEKFESSVNPAAQSSSWQHQAAALLDIVAFMRHAFPDYVATDPDLNQFAIDFFNKRDQYGASVKPVLSADKQVDWLDYTTSSGKRFCLSIMEPYGKNIDQSANIFGLGGGTRAFEGLDSEASQSQNEATFGRYVLGGCQGMKVVPAHPDRLLRVVPDTPTDVLTVATPQSFTEAKALVCQSASLLKKHIAFEMAPPVGNLQELTLGQWIQLKNYRNRVVDANWDAVNKFAKGTKAKGAEAKAIQDLVTASQNAGSTAGYIRQAGEQFVGRRLNGQFRFARNAKTLGEYFDKTFNAKASVNDVGSFRFAYSPVLTYCGL